MRLLSSLFISTIFLASACGSDDAPEPVATEIGDGDHTPSSVTFTVIATAEDGLNQPRDLAFNPLRPNELWVVNYEDDSTLTITDAPSDNRSYEKRIDGYALHFMEQVTAIDFGQDETTFGIPGTFGTCGESRNTYNGQAPGNDFTGPSLWSSDMSVYAAQNPTGLGSHLDMLHNTPLCMGIVHEDANRYWTIGGSHLSIDLYDFELDDGIGNDDHSDGKTWRYAEGQISYTEGVANHLELDHASGMLYIADPGNARVARMDTTAGTEGAVRPSFETQVQVMEGVVVEDFVKDPEFVRAPSGLALTNEQLFVSDYGTGYLLAFDLEGELLNYLDTGLGEGTLSGITFGPDGKLYFVDMVGNRVLRVDVQSDEAL
tara:strand:+ start:77476 stop:78597 length:1122 start_codon:yes stop_codon:yes gene_type:complete